MKQDTFEEEHSSILSPEFPSQEGPFSPGGPRLAWDVGAEGPGLDMGLLVQASGSDQ